MRRIRFDRVRFPDAVLFLRKLISRRKDVLPAAIQLQAVRSQLAEVESDFPAHHTRTAARTPQLVCREKDDTVGNEGQESSSSMPRSEHLPPRLLNPSGSSNDQPSSSTNTQAAGQAAIDGKRAKARAERKRQENEQQKRQWRVRRKAVHADSFGKAETDRVFVSGLRKNRNQPSSPAPSICRLLVLREPDAKPTTAPFFYLSLALFLPPHQPHHSTRTRKAKFPVWRPVHLTHSLTAIAEEKACFFAEKIAYNCLFFALLRFFYCARRRQRRRREGEQSCLLRKEAAAILLVGDSGVGKSSLLVTFISNLVEELAPTIGVDFKIKHLTIGGKKLKLTIWDTVYDVTRRETFTNLSDVWAKEVELYSSNQDCIKMLVGNKVDKENQRVVTREEGIALAQEYGCSFLECSAKTRENVEKCFEELALKLWSFLHHFLAINLKHTTPI
ncbi:hypothetical protein ACLOJK_025276 [Asimina triloba]